MLAMDVRSHSRNVAGTGEMVDMRDDAEVEERPVK
jgi:hypothetical protein